jgi:diacylglycerol kinase (ATP)
VSWLSQRLASFGYAFTGIAQLASGEANARIHALASIAVLVLALLFGIDATGWAILILAIGLVWTAEGMNTAIEALSDRVSPDQDPAVGRAKDVAAGAVLLAALAAAAAGFLVLGPPLWRWLAG